MVKKLKLKIAARRITRAKKPTRKNRIKTVFKNIWAWIKRILTKLWKWIKSIDLIGLINLTLLVAIIVLFSVLISNILRPRDRTVVLVDGHPTAATAEITPNLARGKNRNMDVKLTIPVKKTTRVKLPVHHWGDKVIDGKFGREHIRRGSKINGNLYLDNMRKYTLPCGIKINGDLYLRNVHMMKFCGEFTITGNIYVSRDSSFAPIPRNGKLGGRVIL